MTEESLFVEALDLATGYERQAFLAKACAGNDAQRRRVEQLLSAHERTLGILDHPANSPGWTEYTEDSAAIGVAGDERAGSVIADRYRLIEEIGAGGMGTVWLAEQTQPVRRNVALKLINSGMSSKTVLLRFEAERQALALMDHPNIAKVWDGGTTEAGRPFFVMEYVKGIPITQYCDEARLSIAQRLELFVHVCQAVQHAHTKGVIHRDLKPSNILVCMTDGQAVPKVIDFGLAKATRQPLTENTLHTGHGVLLGTPIYMSPEQAEPHSFDVDTRTDVYALGVVLYELLTGTTPLEKKRFREVAWHEMFWLIKEEEPPRPSDRLSGSEALPNLAAQRRLEPMRLTKLVRGELDWIVMKCLEKDRDRRYETANGLGRDLQRFLSNESVEACPPSASYRFSKFVRRNRGSVIAASMILVLLIAGISGTTIGMLRADRAWASEARRADRESKANQLSQKRLQQIEKGNQILAAVFDDLDPNSEEREDKPLRAILGDRLTEAANQLEGEAVGDALVVANLQNSLGLSLLHLGTPQRATPLFEKALATRAAKLGKNRLETFEVMNNLARAYEDDGKLDKALPLLEKTRELMKTVLGKDDPSTLTCTNNLAGIYQDFGQPRRARGLYEETLKLRKARLGPDHKDTLQSMNNLAFSYETAYELDKALPLLEETLKLRKAKFGPDHRETLNSMNNLAGGYRAAGRSEDAMTLLEETFRRRKAALGPDHPETLNTMSDLAVAYKHAGKRDLALAMLEETFKLTKAKRGPDHPNTLACMNNLAGAYRASADMDKALSLMEEVYKLTLAKLGPNNASTITTMNNLAQGYRAARKLDLALPLLEEALKLRKLNQGEDHPDTLKCMANLASVHRAMNRLDLALPLWEEVLKLARVRPGMDHPDTLVHMNNLAAGYRAADQFDKALPLFKEAALASEKRRFQNEFASNIIDNLVVSLEHQKQFDEAESWRRKWLIVVREKEGPTSMAYADQLRGLGANLVNQKKLADAELTLREAVAIHDRKGSAKFETFDVYSLLGAALVGQERYSEAEPLLIRAFTGMKACEAKIPPSERNRFSETGAQIIKLYEAWGRAEQATEWRTKVSALGGAKSKAKS